MSCSASIVWLARRTAFIAMALFALQSGAATVVNAVPPAVYPGSAPARAMARMIPVATDGTARRIHLAAPTESESADMKATNAAAALDADKRVPLVIGYGRELPTGVRTFALSALVWTAGSDGSLVARVEVSSPGAAALRIALKLSRAAAGLTLRFSGTTADAPVFGPLAAQAFVDDAAPGAVHWSPVIEGDVAVLEFRSTAGAPIDDIVLTVPRVSHQLVTAANLRTLPVKEAKAIGSAGACNVDVACVVPASQALLEAAKAVVRLSFVHDDGRAVGCTGTIVNDSIRSFTPYLFTANHCINSAGSARTLNTFFFYDAIACNVKASPPYVQLVNGAMLLARSPDDDWSLVQLVDPLPAGARLAAWRAAPLAVNDPVATIHHPYADLKKWSQGAFQDVWFQSDDLVYGSFNRVVWEVGTTERGSSGAPLLTLNSAGDYYEVRGGLYAGNASCATPAASDYFSRFDAALPWVRDYLTPDIADPSGLVAAVEFYNRELNHYFVSANQVEIQSLDTGVTRGWERTGLRFLVYGNAVAGTSPVCRFYRAPAFGDSHFYSASPAECSATAAAHPVDWIYESPSVFHVQLPHPVSGACPLRTEPVYRYLSRTTANHRYTTQVIVRDVLAQSGDWIPEGYGPGPYFPAMCAVSPQV